MQLAPRPRRELGSSPSDPSSVCPLERQMAFSLYGHHLNLAAPQAIASF